MKYSKESGQMQKRISDYVTMHLNEFVQYSNYWAEQSLKYLMLINAGGAIAILSFMGASEAVRAMPGPKIALVFFLFGIFSVGFLLITLLRRMRRFHRELSDDANQLYLDKLDWEEVYEKNQERLKISKWADIFGYSSSTCFVIGSGIGIISLFENKESVELLNIRNSFWGKLLIIFGTLCLIVGPILKDKSRTIKDKNGHPAIVPYVQKLWVHKLGSLLIGLGVVSTIFGLILG